MVIFVAIVILAFVVWPVAWGLCKAASKVPPIPTVNIQEEEEENEK
jgi:hypothetical protein